MALDLESMGSGAGAGFVSSIISLLTFNKRLNEKQDKDVCNALHSAIMAEIKNIRADIAHLSMRIDHLINSRK